MQVPLARPRQVPGPVVFSSLNPCNLGVWEISLRFLLPFFFQLAVLGKPWRTGRPRRHGRVSPSRPREEPHTTTCWLLPRPSRRPYLSRLVRAFFFFFFSGASGKSFLPVCLHAITPPSFRFDVRFHQGDGGASTSAAADDATAPDGGDGFIEQVWRGIRSQQRNELFFFCVRIPWRLPLRLFETVSR